MKYEDDKLEQYEKHLAEQEKSPLTISKYIHDIGCFIKFHTARKEEGGNEDLSHEDIIQYKKYLQEHYKTSSVNSMLNALNGYLKYIGRPELCVRMLKQQRQLFREEQRFLQKKDYKKLVEQADREGKTRLSGILQTLCMTGIRVGELHYVTYECLERKIIHIEHKGKVRDIVLPKDLVTLLMKYCKDRGITAGPIFITRSGNPIDRKNVWKEMKQLCERADVNANKVFPHNFRHLFAVSFYERTKDIVRLADYLGHSNLETTRRYTTISTIEACQRELDLGLLVSRIMGNNKIDHRRLKKKNRSRKRNGLCRYY